MSRTIWKYSLEIMDEQRVYPPRGARLLSVQPQGDHPVIWALVDSYEPRGGEWWDVFIVGTGNPADHLPADAAFLGTVQTHGGSLVWHVFTAHCGG